LALLKDLATTTGTAEIKRLLSTNYNMLFSVNQLIYSLTYISHIGDLEEKYKDLDAYFAYISHYDSIYKHALPDNCQDT